MHTMACISRCWAPPEHASVSTSQLSSSHFCHHRRVQQVGCSRGRRVVQVRCSIQEEKVNTTKKISQSLDLPLQSMDDTNIADAVNSVSPQDVRETLKAARAKFGRTTVTKALQDAKRELGKQGVAKLTLIGGAAAVGIFLSGALLSSLEVLPVVPEAMQAVGLAYSVVVASRVIRGSPEKFKVSPVRAVLEILEQGEERTNLVMPGGLDQGTVDAMERLARERDQAVNQVAEMKAEYSQALAEKQALETVALQLAEERQTAMVEVNALKATVESMSDRMKGIEAMLEKEVGQLKSQDQALETVALQLAQERNVAMEQTAILKARSEAEKQALEEVAMQLAQERDDALAELDSLKQKMANMGSRSRNRSSPKTIDLSKQSSLMSHVVDELEVQPPSSGT